MQSRRYGPQRQLRKLVKMLLKWSVQPRVKAFRSAHSCYFNAQLLRGPHSMRKHHKAVECPSVRPSVPSIDSSSSGSHGRPHMGQVGSADPPGTMDEKLQSVNMQKRPVF